jgi:hypothetical protein
MPQQPPSPGKRGRHEAPVRRHALLVSWLLGLSWIAACIVAFFAGFGVAAEIVAPAHPAAGSQQAGLGPALVGLSAMILVCIAGANISILRDRRHRPSAGYNALNYRPNFPASLAVRYNTRVALITIPIAVVGLVLTHLYG